MPEVIWDLGAVLDHITKHHELAYAIHRHGYQNAIHVMLTYNYDVDPW